MIALIKKLHFEISQGKQFFYYLKQFHESVKYNLAFTCPNKSI